MIDPNKQDIYNTIQWSNIKDRKINKMTLKIDKTIGPFYCQTALLLCLEARKLCEKGDCKRVVEICSYTSTLCSKNDFTTCSNESSMCSEAAQYCIGGRGSDNCRKARTACDEAKKLCPQNSMVHGA